MNWRNVITVWTRELRDQLRDRRTLFMVAVLPLLMYPLMGVVFFQLIQFNREHPARVLIVGVEQLEAAGGLPPLFEGDRFAAALDAGARLSKLTVETAPGPAPDAPPSDALFAARKKLTDGQVDAVVLFPSNFAEQMLEIRRRLRAIAVGDEPLASGAPPPEPPRPLVLFNSTREGSQVAYLKVDRLLGNWRKQIAGQNLGGDARVLTGALRPFSVQREDVAEPAAQRAGIWAKLLPFVVFLWALTGAFYPAVDLCAGEKERGTLETLLVSPATRTEIVGGKLLTVLTFSMVTALLNLIGIASAGRFMAEQFATIDPMGLGKPPLYSLLWLVVALPPVAALFSALAFACAAFARSTKEGQYYFMPLFLATLPLMLMPLMPGVELNLGTSLAPVMGLALLVRSLLEGGLLEAVRYAVPVTIVTFGCVLLAIRWAVSQFNQESVLFRGDERFDLRLWLRSVFYKRGETPTVGMAVGCVVMILILQFALRAIQAGSPPTPADLDFDYLSLTTVASQACVVLPALFIAVLLTRSRSRTLLLDRPPRPSTLLTCAGLAIAFHPVVTQLGEVIRWLYPISDGVTSQLKGIEGLIADAGSPWLAVGVLALLPAVCEEITFRGTILSGLRSGGSERWAIVLSAVAFGMVHSLGLQQALSAAAVGLLIGYLAVRTGSLLPGIVFHAVHNALLVLLAYYAKPLEEWLGGAEWRAMLVREHAGEVIGYHPAVTALGAILAVMSLAWIRKRSRLANDGESARIAERLAPPGVALAANDSSES